MAVTDEYRDAVTKLADNKTDRRFLNDSGEHATLLANLMIGRSQADDEVLIYSGELVPAYFENALISAKGKIRILVDDKKGLSVIDNLPKDVRSKIQIKQISAEKDSNHFFVSGKAMRYELSHDKATAVANFNEPDSQIQKLKTTFNKMWDCAISA